MKLGSKDGKGILCDGENWKVYMIISNDTFEIVKE